MIICLREDVRLSQEINEVMNNNEKDDILVYGGSILLAALGVQGKRRHFCGGKP